MNTPEKKSQYFIATCLAAMLIISCSSKIIEDDPIITDPVDSTDTSVVDTSMVDTTIIDTTLQPPVESKKLLLFVGTYTSSNAAKGIYICELNADTGSLKVVNTVGGIANPSYLTVHKNKKWLYAASESGSPNGKVYAYSIDSNLKKLSLLNSVSSMGESPCYVSVSASGNYVTAANYSSGSVGLFSINNDGKLSSSTDVDQHVGSGPNVSRQAGPHAHMVLSSADNKFVYSTDLGIDSIVISELDEDNGKLLPVGFSGWVAPGSGPRHFTIDENHHRMYVLCELMGTIEAFDINTLTGSLTHFQTISNIPSGETTYPGSADIHLSLSGEYLYASNRGTINSIAMYSVNQSNGELNSLGYQSSLGKTPRNFAIDPTGKFLLVANQDSGTIITFRINSETGLLEETGLSVKIPSPVCIKFLNGN